jgi:arginase family enzyme
MRGLVSVLHFDRTFEFDAQLLQPDIEQVDLTDIPGTNGYCRFDTLGRIARRLAKRKRRGVTLIGRGSYHYATFLLAGEVEEPFTLVLFDHHSDMMESPDERTISCGSWALEAMRRLPNLRRVLLIGASRDSIRDIPAPWRSRVIAVPEEAAAAGVDLRRLVRLIPTDAVYVSVDKDVLSPLDARTDWDQGSLHLDALLRMMEAIAAAKRLAGADVCGECPPPPGALWQREALERMRINGHANRQIAGLAARWISRRQDPRHGPGQTAS